MVWLVCVGERGGGVSAGVVQRLRRWGGWGGVGSAIGVVWCGWFGYTYDIYTRLGTLVHAHRGGVGRGREVERTT